MRFSHVTAPLRGNTSLLPDPVGLGGILHQGHRYAASLGSCQSRQKLIKSSRLMFALGGGGGWGGGGG